MKQLKPTFIRLVQTLTIIILALVVYLVVRAWFGGEPAAHALPEYTARTGEPCASCHVNPGGGGPRTMRGLLWAAQGRADQVPQLEGLLAPNVDSGLELYDIACAGCHGFSGEGLLGIDLAERGISQAAARTFIRDGIPELGMPTYAGQFTDEQLDALSAFVAAMGRGEVPPNEYPLPPAELLCQAEAPLVCGGQ